jgi:catechol 2,3-dioxygenase-like lactoylglutathione lyase family enzyme
MVAAATTLDFAARSELFVATGTAIRSVRTKPKQTHTVAREETSTMKAVSHIAVGVRDMDRSLKFYHDLLGLKVCLDTMENIGGLKTLFVEPMKGKRRAVYLRYEDGPHASFIVLSQNPQEVPGGAIKLDQVGVHHFAFWVDDLRERVEKLKAAGVPILVPPMESDTIAYGEPAGKKVLTCLFQDPDGIILQFDQRMT